MQVTIIKTEVCFSPINVSFDSSPPPMELYKWWKFAFCMCMYFKMLKQNVGACLQKCQGLSSFSLKQHCVMAKKQ